MVAKKDNAKPKHDHVDVPNLQVTNLMKSLTSRGYVRENFSWMWHYYFLTDEGIEYLREYLHLPAEIIPATLKKAATARPEGGAREGGERGDFRGGEGRDGYRREGGFGRGGGRPQ